MFTNTREDGQVFAPGIMGNTKVKVTKAVIPAAGLGTRMLPIARAVPKEMLPIVDRPAISYLVDEAVAAGVTDILIITGRDKTSIENFFDYSPEYDQKLTASGKLDQVEQLHEICKKANVYFIRQKETRGLGHAVSKAKAFVGKDPFYVIYGDDVIFSEVPVCEQLRRAFEKYGKAVAGVSEVDMAQIGKYCSLDAKNIQGNEYNVFDMIEKPKPEQVKTNLSILGRVLLTPDIFDILDQTVPGYGGEIQLTDAMGTLAREKGMTAVAFEGTHFDMGSKLGWLKANLTVGLTHPETGESFREYIKSIINSL